jgi:transposase-like protein
MQSALSVTRFHNEDAAFAYVEAELWPNGPVCHHCGGTERIGRLKTRPGLYKCYGCKKQFTVRLGTVFESSHVPLRVWLQAIYMMCSGKKGVSTRQLQRTFGCGMKTAWFLGMRVREAMKVLHIEPMGGEGLTIEADETYVGGKAANRAYGPIPPKQAVVSLVQRDGGVRSFHVPNVTASNLYPLIAKHTHADNRFMTDEAPVYLGIGRTFVEHQTVNHKAKEYVRGEVYTNTVEGYFSVLKRGIYGVYQHVSEAHLKRYLAEFDFRYSNRIKLGVDDQMRSDLALAGVVGKRLTYRSTGGARAAAASA